MVETERPVTESLSTPPKRYISFEDFLAHGPETHAEWVNGEVITMSPPMENHQDVSRMLSALLSHFVEDHDAGRILPAPFLMKTGPGLPGREPDILFITTEHLDRIKRTHLEGPADLAVEIISPESRGRDRGDKFYEYEQGGVREYWLLDPERRQAEFHALGDDGIYRPIPVGDDGVFRSHVPPGLWLRPEWFWQRPLPSLRSVLAEWER
jgi:Uma2 family endonuclease